MSDGGLLFEFVSKVKTGPRRNQDTQFKEKVQQGLKTATTRCWTLEEFERLEQAAGTGCLQKLQTDYNSHSLFGYGLVDTHTDYTHTQ